MLFAGVAVAVLGLVADAEAALVLRQVRADQNVRPANSTACLPPRTWLTEAEFHERYTPEEIENLTRSNLLQTRQNLQKGRRTEYHVHDASGESEFISEEQLHDRYDENTIADMRRKKILRMHVNPGCPKRSAYYTLKQKLISKEKLLQQFDQEAVEEFVKRGIIETHTDPKMPTRGLYLLDYKRLRSELQSSRIEKKKTEKSEVAVKTCGLWCADHKDSWSAKCSWKTNACSACRACTEAQAEENWKKEKMDAAKEEANRQLQKMKAQRELLALQRATNTSMTAA